MSDKLFFIKRTSLSDKGNSDIHRFNILYIVYIFVLFQGRSKQVSQMMIFNDPFGNEIAYYEIANLYIWFLNLTNWKFRKFQTDDDEKYHQVLPWVIHDQIPLSRKHIKKENM